MKNHFAVILNFESGAVDVLSLDNMPEGEDVYEFIEGTLDYSLSNCEWMVTTTPVLRPLNF